MTSRKFLSLSIAATAAIGGLHAIPSLAASIALEEVVVTARKREESIQDVPVSVTAFTGEQIKKQGAFSFRDVAAFTPGFTATPLLGNETAAALSIRGQVQNDNLATLDPSVGTYVDGFNWTRAYGFNTDLLDVQTVQILKGPQGTLFGRNTTGGAVVIQTNNPDLDSFSGTVTGIVGNLGELTGTLIVNAPLSETVAVRAAIKTSERDGYIDDIVSGDEYQARDNDQARVKVLFQPSDFFDLVVSAEWFDYESKPGFIGQYAGAGLTGISLAAPSPYFDSIQDYFDATPLGSYKVAVDGHGLPLFSTLETETYVANAAWHFEAGDLKLIAGMRNIESSQQQDLDGTPYPLHTSNGFQDLESWSVELQYTGDAFSDRLQYAIGATYLEESGTDESLTHAYPDFLNPTLSNFYGDIDNDAIGFYGQGTFALTDKFNVTAGLRYTEETKGNTNRNRTTLRADPSTIIACNHGSGVIADGCFVKVDDANFDDWSYTVGADYRINEDIMVYAKFGDGFRSGGHQLRATSTESSRPFGPETVEEFEVGLKGDFLDNRLRINAAAFWNTLEGKQLSTIFVVPGTTQSFTLLQNAAEQENEGLEIEATGVLTDNLSITLGYAYLDPSYSDFKTVDPASGELVDRSYEAISFVIEEEFSIQVNYVADVDLGELAFNLNYRWNEDYRNNAISPTPGEPVSSELQAVVPGTTAGVGDGFLGASASLTMENGLSLSIWGKNLLEVDAFPHSLYIGAPFNYNSRVVYEPRTYGLTATYAFGN